MNRRKFIAGGGLALTTALAGCYGTYRYFTREDYGEQPFPELPSEERVDTPPYDITDQSINQDNWDPNYLGRNLSTRPSINFTTNVNASLSDEKINLSDMEESNEYLVRVIEDENEMNQILNEGNNLDINFNDEILLVIESGFGSSSFIQQWNRVEETEDGVHIHGYMYIPQNRRTDFRPRSSIVKVQRPSGHSDIKAHVSLTVDAKFRINFDSDEGIVRIPVIG